jgi:hypothetical protein
MVAIALGLAACAEPRYDGSFPEPDDVRLEVPSGAPPAGQRGEVHALVATTAASLDEWIGDVLVAAVPIVQPLADHRETSRDGGTLLFGPFDDPEGRDLAWFVAIDLDGAKTSFDVYVGRRGVTDSADTLPLMEGHIEVDGDLRRGALTLYFGLDDEHPAISDVFATSDREGAVAVGFERDVSTQQRSVDLSFTDFRVDAWSSDETFAYRRAADGSGAFELVLAGQLAGTHADRVELDTRWRDDGSGRARALARDVDNALPNGDLVLDECFDAACVLTYRELADAYAQRLPGYDFGDPLACVFAAHEL